MKLIVSGGQSGADLAGIDWAIKSGLPYEIRTFEGFKPVGGRSLDYTNITYIPYFSSYSSYVSKLRGRTKYNVQHSDCTLIFLDCPIEETSGSRLTLTLCKKYGKPYMPVPIFGEQKIAIQEAGRLMVQYTVVNIAGTRTCNEDTVKLVLDKIWTIGSS